MDNNLQGRSGSFGNVPPGVVPAFSDAPAAAPTGLPQTFGPQPPIAPPPTSPVTTPRKPKRTHKRNPIKLAGYVLFALLLVGGVWAVLGNINNRPAPDATAPNASVANRFDSVQIPLNDLTTGQNVTTLLGTRSLSINGPLKANDTFVISPSGQPSNATAGQIYYDSQTNALAYYNGSAFVQLPGDLPVGTGLSNTGGSLINTGVLSMQGQTGDVTFSAGSGMVIDGTTLSNAGVLSFGGATGDITLGSGLGITDNVLSNTGVNSLTAGTVNLIITDDGEGNLTISNIGGGSATVQSPGGTAGRIAKFTGVQTIADSLLSESGTIVTVDDDLVVTDDLTVNGSLSLAAPLGVSNGGTGAAALTTNGVIIGQGAGALTAVTGSPGLCLQSTAGAPAFSACPGGVTSVNSLTGVLTIANASGVGSTITINDASTSQKGIAQFNATNFTGTGTINTIQNINSGATPTFAGINTNAINPSGAFTVGSTGQQFTMQGTAASVINATNGVTSTTLSFQNPGANVNYRFATASAGTYDVCTMVGNCAGVGGGVTTSGGTIGAIPKFTGSQAIGDSLLSELGTTITVTGNMNITTGNQYQINGAQISSSVLSNDANLAKLNASQSFTGNTNSFVNGSNSATAFSIQNAATNRILTIDTLAGEVELGQGSTLGGKLVFSNATNNNTITLISAVASGPQTITLPDDTGIVCLNTGNCAGAGVTLQSAYNNSTSPEITLDSTRGALTIRDNATPIAGNLLEVQNNAGSTTYFAVSSTGTSTTGSAAATGNINSSGGAIQTAGTDRITNAGNLTNIGNITGAGAITIASSGAGNDITVNGADEFIVQDAAVFSGLATFTTDVDLTLADAENLNITNTVTGTNAVNLIAAVLTNNTSSGTQNIALLQNAAGSGTTDGLLVLDNADTDTAVTRGLQITSAAGGVTTALDVSDSDIVTALLFGANDITGTNFSVTGGTGSFSSNGNATIQGGTVTVGTASVAGKLALHDGSTETGTIQLAALGQDTVYNLPDPGGATVDICLSSGNCSGAAVTLQSAYNNSSTPEITLDATRGAVTIRDNATPIAANLFEVQNNGGGTTYLAVTSSGITVAGSTTSTGNINSSGGTIQTSGSDRISSGGNLVNIGSLALAGSISGGTTYSGAGNINTSGGALQTAGTDRISNGGNLVNIGNITGAGAITVASSGAGNDITIDGADQFIVQDAAVLNALTTFTTDVDFTLAETENINITNTVTGTNSVNLIGAVLTNNTSSGTQQVALLQNAAGSGTTEGLLVLDNADTDTAVTSGIQITSAAGGIGTAIDVSDPDITTALLFGLNDISGTHFTVTGATGAFSTDGNATIQGGTVTIGAAATAASLVMHDGDGETATLLVADLAANRNLTIPAATGNDTFCLLSLANCVGTGGGVSGSGTNNQLAKFTSTGSTIGDSTITDNGTAVTTTVDVVVQGGDLTVGTTSQLASLILHDGNGQSTTLQAGNSGGNLTFILPTTAGSASQCLKQSGTGNQLVWQDCDGGGGGSSATLQTAYNNGANITTTDGRDISIVLADTTTDSNFDLVVADGSTSFVSFTRANGAGTADPAQMLLVDNLDTNRALPIGIKLQAAGGGMTTAIDATDAEIVDALNVAANNIVGTTGNIDFTNFDVVGASGNITTAGDLAVNGGDVSSTGTLTIANGSGNLTLNSTGTIELADSTNVTGNLDASGTLTAGTADAFQVAATGEITSASNATLQGGTVTVGTASQGGTVVIYDGTTHRGSFVTAALSDHRTYTLPDDSGVVCLNTGNCASAGVTLQGAYDNSTSPELVLDGTRGALTIRDNASTVTTLLEVQNNAGSTTYFGVSTSGVSVSGTASVTGAINSSGGTIQTSGTDRIGNTGNLVNIGNITGAGAITIASSGAGNDIIINGADILDVQDAATFAAATTFNGLATFNTDIDVVLAGTEAINITSTKTGADDSVPFTLSLTNNTSSDFQVLGSIVNEDGSGDSEVLLKLDNADPDNAMLFGLFIDSNTGGIGTAIDASASNIDVALNVDGNDIQGSVGNITFDEFSITGATGDIATNGDLDVNGGNIDSTGVLTIANASGNLNLNTAGTIELQDNTNVTGTFSASSTVTVGTLGAAGSTPLCRNGLSQIASCTSNPASVTLQQAYDAGNTILATDARDIAFTLANTATDPNFTISIADDSTSTASITRANGSGTNSPTQLLLLDNLDTNQAIANGIVIQSAAGAITDGLDVSDAELVNAVNIGANTILGTTGDIDLNSFDVVGASGNITTAGDIAVNGSDITSTGALNLNSASTIELQDSTNVGGNLVVNGNATSALTVKASTNGSSALIADFLQSDNDSVMRLTDTGTLGLGNSSSIAGIIALSSGTAFSEIRATNITSARVLQLPNQDGTICVTNGGVSNCESSLQASYNASVGSTTPEIKLDATRNGIEIQDANSSIGSGQNFLSLRGSNAGGLGTVLFGVGIQGNLYMEPSTNRLDTVDINKNGGGNVFTVDTLTSSGRVGIALTSTNNPGYTLDVGGDTNLASGSVYRINGTTICSASGCTAAASSGNYIQNQNAGAQTSSNFWISGTGRADTSLLAPLLDTASGVALDIGTTNATVINLNENTAVAAGKTLTVTSALTSLTGATSGDALNVSNSTSTGNIAVFSDNATAVLTLANGGGAQFRNETNSATAFVVQNATGADTLLTADTAARSGSGGNLIKIGNSTGTDTNTTILQLDGTSADPSTNLSALNGGMFYNSTTHKVSLIENGQVKIICNTTDLGCGTGTVTLQNAYTNSSSPATVTTTDGKNIVFNMADTTTDPNFLIDLQCDTSCSTNGRFAIQDDAADVFTVLPASGGITMGDNTLNTPLTFNSGTGAINMGTGAQARTVNLGTGAADQDVTLGSTSTGSSLTLNAGSGNAVFNATSGSLTLQTTTSGAINIKPVSSDTVNIVLGTAADNIGTLLVLDEKNGSGDPTIANGGMYYNSNMKSFRCAEDGAWRYCNDPVGLSKGYNISEDFIGTSTSTTWGANGWQTSGQTPTVQQPDATNRAGQIELTTGGSSTGVGTLYLGGAAFSGNVEPIRINGGETIEFAINIATPSTAGEEFDVRVGLCDQDTVCDDGLYFEYDRNATASNWRYCATNGSGTTENASSIAVSTGAWTRFKIVVNAAGTSVEYFINGTSAGTITTNIPTGSGDETQGQFTIVKSAGTTARTMRLDYFQFRSSFTTLR